MILGNAFSLLGMVLFAGSASGLALAPLSAHSNDSQTKVAIYTPSSNRATEDFSGGVVVAQARVQGEGNVIAVVPDNEQIVVDHKEIKGFMEAMIMGYKVSPRSLLKGLKPGDKVRFTIDTEKKAIVEIVELK